METYRVTDRTSLKLGGVLHRPGDELEAEPGAVSHLVECGTLVDAASVPAEAAGEVKDLPTREEQIRDAISMLDPGDAAHFTEAGLPRVEAIEEIVGFDITAGERDTVWELLQAA